jgi:hypothetical protein
MTVATTESFVTYTGNGATTLFSFGFMIQTGADVVTLWNAVSGSIPLSSGQYSITGLDNPAGGSVTYPLTGPALPSDFTITIQRVLSPVQNTDISDQANFFPVVIEDALDYLTYLYQQLNFASDSPVEPPTTTRTRFWSSVDNGSASTIPRVLAHRERIFVGAAVDYSALIAGSITGTFGWLTNATGPYWMVRDGAIASVNEDSGIGVSGVARTSDGPTLTNAIGIAGFGLADKISCGAWGGYFESIKSVSGSSSVGVEVDVRNAVAINAPPNPTANGTGPHALWVACGPGSNVGTGGYGPTPLADSGAAMVILPNTTGNNAFRFTKGIVFKSDALSGVNGTDGETAGAGAIELIRGHAIRWYSSDGAIKALLRSQMNTTDVDQSIIWQGTAVIFARNAGTEPTLSVTGVVSAVNYLQLTNSAATTPPIIQATGSDTDIDLRFLTKGAGVLRFGTNIAKAAEAFASYITIKDSGGTLRKVMVCA